MRWQLTSAIVIIRSPISFDIWTCLIPIITTGWLYPFELRMPLQPVLMHCRPWLFDSCFGNHTIEPTQTSPAMSFALSLWTSDGGGPVMAFAFIVFRADGMKQDVRTSIQDVKSEKEMQSSIIKSRSSLLIHYEKIGGAGSSQGLMPHEPAGQSATRLTGMNDRFVTPLHCPFTRCRSCTDIQSFGLCHTYRRKHTGAYGRRVYGRGALITAHKSGLCSLESWGYSASSILLTKGQRRFIIHFLSISCWFLVSLVEMLKSWICGWGRRDARARIQPHQHLDRSGLAESMNMEFAYSLVDPRHFFFHYPVVWLQRECCMTLVTSQDCSVRIHRPTWKDADTSYCQ